MAMRIQVRYVNMRQVLFPRIQQDQRRMFCKRGFFRRGIHRVREAIFSRKRDR